ncbi:MAG: PEP-CTERM sorting domain-containing protein [Planctomycetia bacterium]|nr:PEP-CTERM sorting domain-containing protein [Planctomycetia bacterium]
MIRFLPVLALVLLVSPVSTARAVLLYSESVSGDAGVDPGYAELGSLPAGTHQVIGGNPNFDTDDYHFSIGVGLQLDSILVDSYTALGAAGIQSPVLGNTVLTSASVGQDLLTLSSITAPLGSGGYVLRATTGTGGPTTYQFGFHVSAAFDPSTVVYNEGVSGDAGVNASSVNLGSLAAGHNRVLGGNPDFDGDDFTLTIAPGFQLDSIQVENYTALGSAAIQTPSLGNTTLSSASVGQDFLNLASIPQPIGPGTYMFRATTGTGGPTTYQFDFQVSAVSEASAVPEPSTFILAGLGLMGLGFVALRKKYR